MNRAQYIQEYERIQRKYRKKFFPAVYKAINSIVSSLIDKIQADGVQSAMGDLMLTIINDKIGEPVKRIYSEVGMFHVKNNYRFIRAEIGRKALGRNEIWVQEIIAYLEKNLWQYVVAKPTETLRDHFLRVLQEGIDKEWSVDDIIREIRSDQFARYQAERIVRTEVGRAANTGKKIAADSFPYEMQKEWISFQDMRTRGRVPDDKKDHYHLNGQTVAMDGMFTDPRSGEQIEYPNAPGGSPGMVINCRCTYATTPKRDANGGLIGRTAKINVGIKPTENRFFENSGGEKPIMSNIRSMTGTNSADDLSGLDDILLNAIYKVQSRNRYFKFSGIVKNDKVSLLGASSDNELNIGKRFNKDEIEKAAFLSKEMANRKNYSSASKLINERNSEASEYAEFIIEHELNHVKQNYLSAAAKGGWGDEIEKRAKKWQKEWIDSIGKDDWYPSDYANAIRDISVKEKEWLAESYLLFKNNPELIKSEKIKWLMKEFDNLINDMANAK